jgi:uncharacterized membrane protein
MISRFLMLLALVVWIGGIIFFSFVVAPALFSILPTRELAGAVVQRSLNVLHWIGLVSALVFLIASTLDALNTPGVQYGISRNILMTIALALTLISQFGVTREMSRLRRDMGTIDTVSAADSRRVEFNRLHTASTGLEGGVLLLGLATLVLVAKE